MLHTDLEMSVISVMFPHLHDWEGLCCLPARAAIFLMVLSRRPALITHSELQDQQLSMQAQGREDKIIKLVYSEVCGHSTMFLEGNLMVISNKEKELHLTGTSVFMDY